MSKNSFKQLKISLNRFDTAIFIILGLVVISAYLFFYRKPITIPIRVKVTDQDILYARNLPAPWYANQFNIGDSERDVAGRKIAEINNIDTFQVSSDAVAVYIDIQVRATYDTRSQKYSFKGRELSFGSPVRFNLSEITFDGIVVDNPTLHNQVTYGEAVVTTLGRGIEPFLIQAFKAGDVVKSANDETIIEILSIESTPAEQVVTTDRGELLLRYNPLFKDVIIVLKVKTKEINNQLFLFEDLPLKINEPLPLVLPHVSLFPIITAIETTTP